MQRSAHSPIVTAGRRALAMHPGVPVSRSWSSHWNRRSPAEAASPSELEESALARVEAALFLAREPVSMRKLAQYADLADATEARTLVRKLNARYDEEGRAFRVEQVAGGLQLRTRARIGDWVRRLHAGGPELRMSAPALETLAIIAYRQPIRRADIESIRGVQCGEMLRQLMERELVRIAGRGDELGRPFLYGTTRSFLQTFGLRGLEDLPRMDFLRRPTEVVEVSSENPHNQPDQRAYENEPEIPQENEEERDVTTTLKTSLELEKLRPGRKIAKPSEDLVEKRAPRAGEEDDDDDWDDEDDEEEDDEEDEEEDDELEEDDLDDEWEEVDDDDEELDEDEEDDEDWEEDDEDEDDDWDDDEDDEDEDDEEEWEEGE